MPSIDPDLVPSVSISDIFDELVTNNDYSVRWLTGIDPLYFDVYNRPISDMAMRQLIMAKALTNLSYRLNHQSNFPFVETPVVINGSETVNLPSLMWDMHVTLLGSWTNLRLAKVARMSGVNGSSPTGRIRFIFTADRNSVETHLFYVDYTINTTMTYQLDRINAVDMSWTTPNIPSNEEATINGYVIFKTLDVDDSVMAGFVSLVAPPESASAGDYGSDSDYDDPAVYAVADNTIGTIFGATINHGSGIVTSSAFNISVPTDTTIEPWLEAFNFPFNVSATRRSITPIVTTIPSLLFAELNINAPDDQKAWISRIVRNDTPQSATFYLSTTGYDSTVVEFAYFTITPTDDYKDEITVYPYETLYDTTTSGQMQGFGNGRGILGPAFGTSEITDFFTALDTISDSPAILYFSQDATLLSMLALSLSSTTVPTSDMFDASSGTSGTPSSTNKYVTEADSGRGDTVSLADEFGHVSGISNTGYMQTRIQRLVDLSIDHTGTFTQDQLTERLKYLFGLESSEDFEFGMMWFNGTSLNFFTGSEWIAL